MQLCTMSFSIVTLSLICSIRPLSIIALKWIKNSLLNVAESGIIFNTICPLSFCLVSLRRMSWRHLHIVHKCKKPYHFFSLSGQRAKRFKENPPIVERDGTVGKMETERQTFFIFLSWSGVGFEPSILRLWG